MMLLKILEKQKSWAIMDARLIGKVRAVNGMETPDDDIYCPLRFPDSLSISFGFQLTTLTNT